MVYLVNFCNSSVCLNGTKCIGRMNLEYDIYEKLFIARFKEMNNGMNNFNNIGNYQCPLYIFIIYRNVLLIIC